MLIAIIATYYAHIETPDYFIFLYNIIRIEIKFTKKFQNSLCCYDTKYIDLILLNEQIEKFFKSSDRTFSGKAVAAFHTHPGWTGFPQFGTPEASEGDEDGILANFIHNGGLNIPFFIFAKHKMTSGNITSNIARYKYDSWKGVERRLLPQSHGVELENE